MCLWAVLVSSGFGDCSVACCLIVLLMVFLRWVSCLVVWLYLVILLTFVFLIVFNWL